MVREIVQYSYTCWWMMCNSLQRSNINNNTNTNTNIFNSYNHSSITQNSVIIGGNMGNNNVTISAYSSGNLSIVNVGTSKSNCEANRNDPGMVSGVDRPQRIVGSAGASKTKKKEKRTIINHMTIKDWCWKISNTSVFHTIGDTIGYQASKKKYQIRDSIYLWNNNEPNIIPPQQ